MVVVSFVITGNRIYQIVLCRITATSFQFKTNEIRIEHLMKCFLKYDMFIIMFVNVFSAHAWASIISAKYSTAALVHEEFIFYFKFFRLKILGFSIFLPVLTTPNRLIQKCEFLFNSNQVIGQPNLPFFHRCLEFLIQQTKIVCLSLRATMVDVVRRNSFRMSVFVEFHCFE